MAFLLTDDLSLWDTVEGSSTHDYLGLDYGSLRSDWENKDKLNDDLDRVSERVEQSSTCDEKQLLLLDELDALGDDATFSHWMEEKFDFDECMTFNSLEDVEMLLKDNEYEQIEKNDSPNSVASSAQEEENQVTPQEIPATVDVNLGFNCEQLLINLIVNNNSTHINTETLVIGKETKREREKPYSRCKPAKRRVTTSENKKSRKRNQNRDAATRYRMKKKEQADAMSGEEERLTKINEQLSKRVDNLSTEINYLKGLMKELIQAKRK